MDRFRGPTRRLVRRCILFAIAMLTAAAGTVAPAQAVPSDTTAGYYLAVTGANLNPSTVYTPDQITHAAQAAGGSVAPGDGAPAVSPAGVAQGYVLFNPGRVNGINGRLYIYDSDWGPIEEVYCNGGCTVESKWHTHVHLYLNGGRSKSWVITMNARHNSGYTSVSFDYYYECAINVSGGPDHECSTGHGADPSDSGPLNPGDTIHKYFERNDYSNTEYAQVAIGVQFHHSYNQNKDRLADVCVTARTT
ncbi:MAG: hypothetical protein J2P17_34285, partial [Mycobacterium sp.]|nr:hypothetical protein [Mycobacterium sp.]